MLYTAFFFGLVSSLHCMGMCGPIAFMLPVSHDRPALKAVQIMTYHMGRLLSYGFIGLLFGFFGRGLALAGMQQDLSIFTGIAILIIVLLPTKIVAGYTSSGPIYKAVATVKSGLGKHFKKKSLGSLFLIGFLNGLLPCAMVYAALFGALSMQTAGGGALYMMVFGLGTIPLMSAVVYMHNLVSSPMRNTFRKIVPIAATVIGILFICRGLGLAIPFVSPSEMSLMVQAVPECR